MAVEGSNERRRNESQDSGATLRQGHAGGRHRAAAAPRMVAWHLACAHEANKPRATSYVRAEKAGLAFLSPHQTLRPPSALNFPSSFSLPPPFSPASPSFPPTIIHGPFPYLVAGFSPWQLAPAKADCAGAPRKPDLAGVLGNRHQAPGERGAVSLRCCAVRCSCRFATPFTCHAPPLSLSHTHRVNFYKSSSHF